MMYDFREQLHRSGIMVEKINLIKEETPKE